MGGSCKDAENGYGIRELVNSIFESHDAMIYLKGAEALNWVVEGPQYVDDKDQYLMLIIAPEGNFRRIVIAGDIAPVQNIAASIIGAYEAGRKVGRNGG